MFSGAIQQMSMNMFVYVGPYIKALDFDKDILCEDEFIDMFYNARGEMDGSNNDEHVYLAPNQKISGIDRKTNFSHYDYPPVIEITDTEKEIIEFAKFAESIMTAIHDDGGKAEIRWGIICGVF